MKKIFSSMRGALTRESAAARQDVKIAGAGLFGCVCARMLAESGRRVTVYDRRDCIGGNCATYYDRGIEVHKYGCHIFHTDDDGVWKFVNRFTAFNQYQHRCVAVRGGFRYFMPVNLMMLQQFFGRPLSGPAEAEEFMRGKIEGDLARLGIDGASPRNFEEQAIALVGAELYGAFIEGYTRKQWNCDPKALGADVIRRLPVRYNYDIGYYYDRYQGIPLDGYGRMLDRVVGHPNIEVVLGSDYGELDLARDAARGDFVIFTGALDELFGYRFGALPWRSLRFETEGKDEKDWQGNSTVNYVDADVPYTRIHEFKHFHPEDAAVRRMEYTVVQREYPDDWSAGKERYYPVDSAESRRLYGRYAGLMLEKYGKNAVAGGRLGMYRYFDMDDTVKAAMDLCGRILAADPTV